MRTCVAVVWLLAVVSVAGCAEDAGTAAPKDSTQTADSEDGTTGATDAATTADSSGDPCSGQTCSGQGVCKVEAGAAKCTCNANYSAEAGLTCLQTKQVPCKAAAPEHATAVVADVNVTYTDAGGWSEPAACDFACDSGWARVGNSCMAATFVQDQCRLSCLELQACGQGGSGTVQNCTKACVTAATNADTFAKAACVGLSYEHDSLWCGVISACDTLASGDTCATRCAAKDKCGFLKSPGITSGSSQAECEVLCRAYDTVYANLKTTDAYAECLDKAAASCDPFQLALCEAYNGADVCGNVCGWLGTDKFCNYIPGRWADEAACKAECGAWTPKQAHAVFGCYNKLNFNSCDQTRALTCLNPPTELPASVTALTAAVAKVCPDVMASSDPGVNAWHFLGRTQLWPAWMQDFGAATQCIEAFTSCPSTYDFDWLATCFVTIAPEVTTACKAASQCLSKSQTQVPYLTIDGKTWMDPVRCQVAWQDIKAKEPAAFDKVASCLAKANVKDCQEVEACIAGADPKAAACNELVACWDTAGSNPYALADMDTGTCGGLLTFGQNPAVAECVLKATDCAAKNACLPITGLAANAIPACTQLVPCWDEAGVNPFASLGKLTIAKCAAATSVYNANFPGVADMIFGCVQGASDCKAKMACLPK
jgi:hypothetical protein